MNFIFVHGNPGTPEDFRRLRSFLGREMDAIAPRREELTRVLVEHHGQDYILVAYSWAAYWVLKLLPGLEKKPSRLVLVAPYLFDPKPMGSLAQSLMGLKPLRNLILRGLASKWKKDFVARLFSQAVPFFFADEPLSKALDDSKTWQIVVERKLQQQREALPLQALSLSCPVDVILATQDKISPLGDSRAKIAILLPQATVHEFTGASHGLIWTDAEKLGLTLRKIADGIVPPTERIKI